MRHDPFSRCSSSSAGRIGSAGQDAQQMRRRVRPPSPLLEDAARSLEMLFATAGDPLPHPSCGAASRRVGAATRHNIEHAPAEGSIEISAVLRRR